MYCNCMVTFLNYNDDYNPYCYYNIATSYGLASYSKQHPNTVILYNWCIAINSISQQSDVYNYGRPCLTVV